MPMISTTFQIVIFWLIIAYFQILTICGIAMIHKNGFRPIALIIAPKIIVPINPPIQNSDTSHDISSVSSGPLCSGVRSADSNVSKLTEGQPIVVPYPIIKRFATIQLKFLILKYCNIAHEQKYSPLIVAKYWCLALFLIEELI